MKRIAVFGLGEAGSLIAADLAAAGMQVTGYDPAPVPTPAGIVRVDSPADAVPHAQAVLGITAQADALTALTQALDTIPAGTLYADLSTSAAGLKCRLAGIATEHDLQFADVALMATVPGRGLRTPALVSGSGAELFAQTFSNAGMPVQSIGANAGDAATRKLLRSVMMKGLAALVLEAMRAGHAAGCAEWLWGNLADEIAAADEGLLARLVLGTGPHAKRRLHEMEACAALLQELGIEPVMTRSTVESLRRVPAEGLPSIPVRKP